MTHVEYNVCTSVWLAANLVFCVSCARGSPKLVKTRPRDHHQVRNHCLSRAVKQTTAASAINAL